MPSTSWHRSHGFSLLEMVVAMAILALSLSVLYQATSGATRNVRSDEKYAYAVELARSVLADNAKIPLAGVSAGGETVSGFSWQVSSGKVAGNDLKIPPGLLHTIEVSVAWQDGSKERSVVLHSVVAGGKGQ